MEEDPNGTRNNDEADSMPRCSYDKDNQENKDNPHDILPLMLLQTSLPLWRATKSLTAELVGTRTGTAPIRR